VCGIDTSLFVLFVCLFCLFVCLFGIGSVVVSFRGTESSSIKNWIDDLKNVKMVAYKNSTTLKIGEGWYSSYNSVRSQVLSGVSSLVRSYPSASIAVVGHSLGAALAGTCAIDLVENGYKGVLVYDYGEPRIGNQAMANYLNQKIATYYRTVNGRDIVPDLPLEIMVSHTPMYRSKPAAVQLLILLVADPRATVTKPLRSGRILQTE
jgi:predicted lipase